MLCFIHNKQIDATYLQYFLKIKDKTNDTV